MICVSTLSSLYKTPFIEGVADLQKKDNVDIDWINTQYTHTAVCDNNSCVNLSRTEASTCSSISNRTEITNGRSRSVKQEQFNVETFVDSETELRGYRSLAYSDEKHKFDKHDVGNSFEMSKKIHSTTDHMKTTRLGVKRKAEERVVDELYIQSKRLSPFLNTLIERREERKKILKISIKKLKQVDDPETYLRRTVLVTNTMKRLQMEVRDDKRRYRAFESNDRSCFIGYGVLSNNYMPNSYLYDDPFLSGANEKITDDMTDTLISNVLYDKGNDRTSVCDIGEKSDLVSRDTESMDIQTNVNSSLLASLISSENEYSSYVEETEKMCICRTCVENKTDKQEMAIGTYCDLESQLYM